VVNPDELKHAMKYDTVVSRHYRGFDYRRAHLVQLSEKQAMYVSYRIGDKVYWTRRKVSLHPGETLITNLIAMLNFLLDACNCFMRQYLCTFTFAVAHQWYS
jgi:hypothetical protein